MSMSKTVRRSMATWRTILDAATPAQRASVFTQHAHVKKALAQYYTAPATPAMIHPHDVFGPFPERVWWKFERCSASNLTGVSPMVYAAGVYRRSRSEMLNARPKKQHKMRAIMDAAYDASEAAPAIVERLMGEKPADELNWDNLPTIQLGEAGGREVGSVSVGSVAQVADECSWDEAVEREIDIVRLGPDAYEHRHGQWLKIATQPKRTRDDAARIIRL